MLPVSESGIELIDTWLWDETRGTITERYTTYPGNCTVGFDLWGWAVLGHNDEPRMLVEGPVFSPVFANERVRPLLHQVRVVERVLIGVDRESRDVDAEALGDSLELAETVSGSGDLRHRRDSLPVDQDVEPFADVPDRDAVLDGEGIDAGRGEEPGGAVDQVSVTLSPDGFAVDGRFASVVADPRIRDILRLHGPVGPVRFELGDGSVELLNVNADHRVLYLVVRHDSDPPALSGPAASEVA